MSVVINTLDEIDILVRESPQNLIVWIVVPNQGRLGGRTGTLIAMGVSRRIVGLAALSSGML
jgi:hypothetical protein